MQSKQGKKIGIMGGTFDPIHIGHLIIAENAKDKYQLDMVMIMPNGNPKYKEEQGVTSVEDRIRMTEIAIADNPDFQMSLLETKRKGYTYTYETLEQLKSEYPENIYYFIMGADSLFSLDSWMHPERICSNCTILLANRYHTKNHELDRRIEQLIEQYGAKILKLDCPNIDVSSEMIRRRIRENRTITYFVPKEVEQYIREQNLYQ